MRTAPCNAHKPGFAEGFASSAQDRFNAPTGVTPKLRKLVVAVDSVRKSLIRIRIQEAGKWQEVVISPLILGTDRPKSTRELVLETAMVMARNATEYRVTVVFDATGTGQFESTRVFYFNIEQ